MLTLLITSPLALAATWTVPGDFDTLQAAVDAASDGDVIEVSAGTWAGPLTVSVDLDIVGVDGAEATTLSHEGTAISVRGATLSIEGFTFDSGDERALSVSEGTALVSGARFVSAGGAASASDSALEFVGVTFEGADAGSGSGGFLSLRDSTLHLDGCTLSGGRAELGGAIYARDSDLTLRDSAFDANEAAGGSLPRGGAIRLEGGALSLDGVTFVGNLADGGFGGALSLNGAAATIADSAFSQNEARTLQAGAIAIFDGDARISGSVFDSNLSTDTSGGGQAYGGAVLMAGDAAGLLEITTSTFTDNRSTDFGGALHVSSGALALSDCTFDGNEGGSGGAIYISSAEDAELHRGAFTGNAAASGGAVRWRPSVSSSSLTVSDSTFETNLSEGYGGGLYAYGGGALVVHSSRFIDNVGSLGGGMMAFAVRDIEALSNVLCGNQAVDDAQSYGGGALAYQSGVDGHVWANNVFVANSADARGGGLALWGGDAAEVVNNDLIANTAGDRGQGAYITDNPVNLINNLVLAHADGVALETNSRPDAWLAWSLFDGNADNVDDHLADNQGDGLLYTDPGLDPATFTGDCRVDTWVPAEGSPLIDAGDPQRLDPDGSRSDIGYTGGPYADPRLFTDADADGWVAWYDCDDTDPGAFPGADEQPYDGVDQDCDGQDLVDVDGDGWVAEEAGGEDCDDTDPAVNPAATEVPDDGVDSDCDGDEGGVTPGDDTGDDGGDDSGDPLDDTGLGEKADGCGCAAAPRPNAAWLALLALLWRRRR